jgi:hypothetical protein
MSSGPREKRELKKSAKRETEIELIRLEERIQEYGKDLDIIGRLAFS